MYAKYNGFIVFEHLGGYRYRHTEHPELSGSSPSLIDCVREIDELCAPPVMRLKATPFVLGAMCWALAFAVVWGW